MKLDLSGLSDAIWSGGAFDRRQMEALLDDAIARGTDALVVAKQFEQFLDPAYAPVRNARGRLVRNQRKAIVTSTPGRGGSGSYPARRLTRTEITAAHGQRLIERARLNPTTSGIRWNLSRAHPEPDECDVNAHGGDGTGVYKPNDVPPYPQHPQCLCYLTIELGDLDAYLRTLRAEPEPNPGAIERAPGEVDLSARSPLLRALQAAENVIWRQTFETAVAFDLSGREIFRKDGAESSVEFTVDEAETLRGSAFTHNHPDGHNWPENNPRRAGNSFSPQDVSFAVRHDFAVIRAVTPTRTFTLFRPASGWPLSDALEGRIALVESSVRAQFYAEIRAGTRSIDAAGADHWHEVWTRIADRYGLRYVVTPHGGPLP